MPVAVFGLIINKKILQRNSLICLSFEPARRIFFELEIAYFSGVKA